MRRVHFVYPSGPAIACPDAIGRNVAIRLKERYEVELYGWDEATRIIPGDDDVLIGHPHPAPWTVFRRSLDREGWKRTIILCPYHHGDAVQMAWADPIVSRCDLFLAITGNYWFKSVRESTFSHWAPKMRHIDLAVDRRDFPPIKKGFNSPGERRFLYIGHSRWTKNTTYLSDIAAMDPSTRISWIGSGRRAISGLEGFGAKDFSQSAAQDLVASHDFLLTVGRADANPAAILEAMSWGLLPICTRESGYEGFPGVVNIPLDDPTQVVRVMRRLQTLDASMLEEMRIQNWGILESHFNWDRFAGQVIDAIESNDSPTIAGPSSRNNVKIRRARISSPFAWWRPFQVLRAIKSRWASPRKQSYKGRDPVV